MTKIGTTNYELRKGQPHQETDKTGKPLSQPPPRREVGTYRGENRSALS
jgi:hypothetical protein